MRDLENILDEKWFNPIGNICNNRDFNMPKEISNLDLVEKSLYHGNIFEIYKNERGNKFFVCIQWREQIEKDVYGLLKCQWLESKDEYFDKIFEALFKRY